MPEHERGMKSPVSATKSPPTTRWTFVRRASTFAAVAVAVVVTTTGTCALAGAAGRANILGPTNAQRTVLARHELGHLFALAPLPGRARRVSAAEARRLSKLATFTAPPFVGVDQLSGERFYVATSGRRALTEIEGATVAGRPPSERGTSGGPGTGNATNLTFSVATSGVLNESQLVYTMVLSPVGVLFFSVDATVGFTPQKSPNALVAERATRLAATYFRGVNVTQHRYVHTATTNVAVIRAVVKRVNALPVTAPGVYHCPFDQGQTLTLSFQSAPGTPPYARVVADPGGCGVVTVDQLRANGTTRASATLGGGATIVAFVLTRLHLR